MSKYPRGSEWRKWDLHIHSNASDGSASPEEIIEEAKAKGLSVIALTDHHTVKNIDQIKEIAKNEGITVISGIEFRSEYGSKSVHFIGYFPDYYNGIELNEKALEDLILSKLGVSETQVISKGKEIDSSANGVDAFKKGMFLVQVDFKEASKLIHQHGGLVAVHNGSKNNGLDKEMKHQGAAEKNVTELYDSLGTVKEELLSKNFINICEISKENDSEDFYLEKFNKPSIITSDAHSKTEIGNKFVWIKADPTFEGLKQIVYEPLERVRIQEGKPEEKAGYYVIDSIHIEKEKIWNQTILLSSNLSTIIGGRSTGKSTLLKSITKNISPKMIEDEFVSGFSDSVSVKWKDGESTSERDIDYFRQNYMYDISKDTNKVDELIEKIVRDKDENKALLNYKKFCDENRIELIDNINTLFKLQKNIDILNNDLKENGDKKGIEHEIAKINENLGKIQLDNISDESLEDYETTNKSLSEMSEQVANLNKDLSVIDAISAKDIITKSIEYDFNELSEATRNDFKSGFLSLSKDVRSKWQKQIEEYAKQIKKNIKKLEEHIEKQKKIPKYSSILEYLEKNQYHKEQIARLTSENKKLSQYKELEAKIKNQNSDKKKLIEQIIELHCNYYVKAQEVLSLTKFECEDIVISPQIIYDQEKLTSYFNERLSLKGITRQNYIKNYIKKYEKNQKEKLAEFINLALNKEIEYKGIYQDKTQPTVVSDLLSTNWFYITYQVKYQNDVFSDMSQGKQAFVILKLLLEFSDKKCPILIDQPEDSLDNRAIYNELVIYLKSKKKERQIILATHNPNVVIGADAEQVIVANQHGKDSKNKDSIKFQYKTGSIENTKKKDEKQNIILESQGIKEHICEILEGGDEAFIKRENKYGFKN